MDIDELLRGYSNQVECIARVMMSLEILMNKGLIKAEDISKVFTSENLTTYIKIVQEQKKKRLKELDKDDTI